MNREAEDWRQAAIEGGGTGELRPGRLDPDPLDVTYDEIVERRRYPPRRDRRAVLLAIVAGLGLVFLAGAWAGRVTATPKATQHPLTFAPVRIPAAQEEEPTPSVSAPGTILEPAPSQSEVAPVGDVAPAPELVVVTPRPVVVVPPASGVSGPASWYDDPKKSGLYAAAGPALRVGDWRGRLVTVCGAVCFQLRLSDWCGCPGGRVIDLSSGAFARLAPLSQGLVSVRVSW